MNIQTGDKFSWSRTFTAEDVLRFGELTGDRGIHHVRPDDQGRLMVHGLLTASIGTKIGGDLNYIAREMTSEFIRPVFTGDTVTCEVTIEKVEQKEGYKTVEMKAEYRNQHGKVVMYGSSSGNRGLKKIILREGYCCLSGEPATRKKSMLRRENGNGFKSGICPICL